MNRRRPLPPLGRATTPEEATDAVVDADIPFEPGTARAALRHRDFRIFWAGTVAEARGYDLALSADPVDTGLSLVSTYDVRFAGYGGSPIAAWLHLPARSAGDGVPLPVVAEYIGYGGGRGLPHERLLYALAGYAHLVMDTRGQGSGWSIGHTPDPQASSHTSAM